jgi:hypothetical protein
MTDTASLVSRNRLTPQFVAMNGRDKWEMLVLHGLVGTDEPWIAALTRTLRAEAAEITRLTEAELFAKRQWHQESRRAEQLANEIAALRARGSSHDDA